LPRPANIDVHQAMAAQIDTELAPLITGLQVSPLLIPNPTPPAIEITPGEPYEELVGMGLGNKILHLIVRALVNTPDNEGAQELLLSMMDSGQPTSVERAILEDVTLGGVVGDVTVEDGPSGFGLWPPPGGGLLLSCTWNVQVIPE